MICHQQINTYIILSLYNRKINNEGTGSLHKTTIHHIIAFQKNLLLRPMAFRHVLSARRQRSREKLQTTSLKWMETMVKLW